MLQNILVRSLLTRRAARGLPTLLAAGVIAGCSGNAGDQPGGSGPTAPTPPVTPVTPVTPIVADTGTPAGLAVTKQIGPEGGTLATDDGGFSVTFPAGTVATSTAFTVRPFVNTAPHSFGPEYRLEPTSFKLPKGATVTLSVPLSMLGTTSPSWLGLAVRSGAVWYAIPGSTSRVQSAQARKAQFPGAPARTVVPSASAQSDSTGTIALRAQDAAVVQYPADDDLPALPPVRWTISTFWVVEPSRATVQVGETLALSVKACVIEAGNDNTLILRDPCAPSIREGTWFVNDVSGGNAATGTVAAGTPTSQATFRAPSTVPARNVVLVRPTMYWRARGLTARLDSVPIRIVGGDLTGGAAGTVTSPVTAIGVLYDYKATVVWKKQRSAELSFEDEYRPDSNKSFIAYKPRNRCIGRIVPDTVFIKSFEVKLIIDNLSDSWRVEGIVAPRLGYEDICTRTSNNLDCTAVALADFKGNGPVKGNAEKLNYGCLIDVSYTYEREGESRRVSADVKLGDTARGVRISQPRNTATDRARVPALQRSAATGRLTALLPATPRALFLDQVDRNRDVLRRPR